jgi:hypothetical protein
LIFSHNGPVAARARNPTHPEPDWCSPADTSAGHLPCGILGSCRRAVPIDVSLRVAWPNASLCYRLEQSSAGPIMIHELAGRHLFTIDAPEEGG